MNLPKLTDVTRNHVVTLDDDIVVTFQLQPIPGKVYQQIIDDHKDEDGRAPHEDVAVDMLLHGIRSVYSSFEATPAEFTPADAQELWDTWPNYARWGLYTAVVAYSTKGPAADPFAKPGQRKNDDA